MYTRHLVAGSAKDRWILPGMAMGVAAGTIFITLQMVAAVFVGQSSFRPWAWQGPRRSGRLL